MNYRNVSTFGPDDQNVRMQGASMWRWDKHLAPVSGTWGVICGNPELAYMQGAQPGNVHINCIVDDFGNLVRKA